MSTIAELAIDWSGPPGVYFTLMRHDGDCPAIETQRAGDCRCSPIAESVSEAAWLASVRLTRAQRRKAERAAAKAMRRAAKGVRR